MCQDGGMIWECDQPNCGRAVCSVCLEVPEEELEKLKGPNVKFTCVRCHWSWGKSSIPYFVSAFLFLFYATKIYLIFLQGFTLNNKPMLKKFLNVRGTFEASIGATVHSPPTLLLHLCLHSIRHTAHFTIVDDLLSEYYSNSNALKVLDLPFNLGHDQAAIKWKSDTTKLVAGLSGFRHVVVFVTVHSVPENGDLWFGHNKAEEPCATQVGEVNNILFYFF